MNRQLNNSEIPFKIDRKVKEDLVSQVVGGFRQAIGNGYYKAGDTLPTIRELAPMLGVSVRVTAAAVKMLAAEGFVSPRSRRGSVVLARNETLWKGTVLLVVPDGYGYYHAELGGRIRQLLVGAGFICMQVVVPGVSGARGKPAYDVSTLEFALGRRADLAILLFNCREAVGVLRRCGVPYVAVGDSAETGRGCVGCMPFDVREAMDAFAAHCRSAGVRRVVQVCKGGAESSAADSLSAVGVRVSSKVIKPLRAGGQGRLWDIQRSALDLFRAWNAEKSFAWPDLIYVTDDYVASAVILALEHLRVRVPGDVRLVVFSNRGHGPVAWDSLTRIENDVRSHGDVVALGVLSFLESGQVPKGLSLKSTYIAGESFPVSE